MKKKVILVSGKARHGKNQFSEYLVDELQNQGYITSTDLFAGNLKKWCNEDFKSLANVLDNIAEEIKAQIGVYFDTRSEMAGDQTFKNIESSIDKLKIKDENWYEDKTDITRSILQLVGTEIFRKRVDDNWWVNQLKDRCINSNSDFIIVTDCRFKNEIEGILCNDFDTIAIRVERNINTDNWVAAHDSETALDNWKEWNFIVDNNGSLDDLKESVKVVLDDIINKKKEEINGLFTRR